jgi:glycosyltransferase involved in cell wall biosynthesis
MDPRGSKVGGIETHLRLMLRYPPSSCRMLFVGVDSRGDCKLGQVITANLDGQSFDFLPVSFFPEDQIHSAAKSLGQSLTFRFGIGLVGYFRSIRKATRSMTGSIELQRFEFALLPRLLGKPAIQIIHGEGSKADKMDSLIKKYWFLHRANEEIAVRLANKIVCVNSNIVRRLEEEFKVKGDRVVCMAVSVDTATFGQTDFDVNDGIFRVMFAGRLDEFKDPPTMFKVLHEVHGRLNGAFEFHYVGTSDPDRYPESKLIDGFMIRHGFCNPTEVAAIATRCHAGFLTSFFEGMPCYLLEMLSVGRPVVAIRLSQFDEVIEEGVSGYMVERIPEEPSLIAQLADRLAGVWSAILQGRIDPKVIHQKIEKFSVKIQLMEHFARHRSLVEKNLPLSKIRDQYHLSNNGPLREAEHSARLVPIASGEAVTAAKPTGIEIAHGPEIEAADGRKP